MTELESIEKIRKAIADLHSRANYACKLNTILVTGFDQLKTVIQTWVEVSDKKYRYEFIRDYKRLLTCSLILELCTIFDPHNPKYEQYSIDAIFKFINDHIEENRRSVFDKASELNNLNCPYFKTLNNLPTRTKITDLEILYCLKSEKEEFVRVNKTGLTSIRSTRNKHLVHPDLSYSMPDIEVSFLIEASEWCECFVNLIHNLIFNGVARSYIEETRKQLRGFDTDNYNNIFKEILST